MRGAWELLLLFVASTTAAATVHPSLYLGPDDIAVLRQKMLDTSDNNFFKVKPSAVWDAIKKKADNDIARGLGISATYQCRNGSVMSVNWAYNLDYTQPPPMVSDLIQM